MPLFIFTGDVVPDKAAVWSGPYVRSEGQVLAVIELTLNRGDGVREDAWQN